MTRKRLNLLNIYAIFTLAMTLMPLLLKAAPVHDFTDIQQYTEGCYYNYHRYDEGDRIITNEPCLNCTCHNKMLMCYLRVCPFTKPISHECIVEKRADQCCPTITCPEVPVDIDHQLTEVGGPLDSHDSHEKFGCSVGGKVYAEGAQVPSNPNKPCELCYCIKNRTSCLMQECTLHIESCTPIYNRGSCCPVRYNCDHENDVLELEDLSESSTRFTTERSTPGFILTTTTLPQHSFECTHNGNSYPDGSRIYRENSCENCYCMRGDIICAVQECSEPVLSSDGMACQALHSNYTECCPNHYVCDKKSLPSDMVRTTTLPYREDVTELSKNFLSVDKIHESISQEDMQLQTHIEADEDNVMATDSSIISTKLIEKVGPAKSTENVMGEAVPTSKTNMQLSTLAYSEDASTETREYDETTTEGEEKYDTNTLIKENFPFTARPQELFRSEELERDSQTNEKLFTDNPYVVTHKEVQFSKDNLGWMGETQPSTATPIEWTEVKESLEDNKISKQSFTHSTSGVFYEPTIIEKSEYFTTMPKDYITSRGEDSRNKVKANKSENSNYTFSIELLDGKLKETPEYSKIPISVATTDISVSAVTQNYDTYTTHAPPMTEFDININNNTERLDEYLYKKLSSLEDESSTTTANMDTQSSSISSETIGNLLDRKSTDPSTSTAFELEYFDNEASETLQTSKHHDIIIDTHEKQDQIDRKHTTNSLNINEYYITNSVGDTTKSYKTDMAAVELATAAPEDDIYEKGKVPFGKKTSKVVSIYSTTQNENINVDTETLPSTSLVDIIPNYSENIEKYTPSEEPDHVTEQIKAHNKTKSQVIDEMKKEAQLADHEKINVGNLYWATTEANQQTSEDKYLVISTVGTETEISNSDIVSTTPYESEKQIVDDKFTLQQLIGLDFNDIPSEHFVELESDSLYSTLPTLRRHETDVFTPTIVTSTELNNEHISKSKLIEEENKWYIKAPNAEEMYGGNELVLPYEKMTPYHQGVFEATELPSVKDKETDTPANVKEFPKILNDNLYMESEKQLITLKDFKEDSPTTIESIQLLKKQDDMSPDVKHLSEKALDDLVDIETTKKGLSNVANDALLIKNLPHVIPGEGSCLVGQKTFENNATVPTPSGCKISCKCVNSIVLCEHMKCRIPDIASCILNNTSFEKCCPKYICATGATGTTAEESGTDANTETFLQASLSQLNDKKALDTVDNETTLHMTEAPFVKDNDKQSYKDSTTEAMLTESAPVNKDEYSTSYMPTTADLEEIISSHTNVPNLSSSTMTYEAKTQVYDPKKINSEDDNDTFFKETPTPTPTPSTFTINGKEMSSNELLKMHTYTPMVNYYTTIPNTVLPQHKTELVPSEPHTVTNTFSLNNNIVEKYTTEYFEPTLIQESNIPTKTDNSIEFMFNSTFDNELYEPLIVTTHDISEPSHTTFNSPIVGPRAQITSSVNNEVNKYVTEAESSTDVNLNTEYLKLTTLSSMTTPYMHNTYISQKIDENLPNMSSTTVHGFEFTTQLPTVQAEKDRHRELTTYSLEDRDKSTETIHFDKALETHTGITTLLKDKTEHLDKTKSMYSKDEDNYGVTLNRSEEPLVTIAELETKINTKSNHMLQEPTAEDLTTSTMTILTDVEKGTSEKADVGLYSLKNVDTPNKWNTLDETTSIVQKMLEQIEKETFPEHKQYGEDSTTMFSIPTKSVERSTLSSDSHLKLYEDSFKPDQISLPGEHSANENTHDTAITTTALVTSATSSTTAIPLSSTEHYQQQLPIYAQPPQYPSYPDDDYTEEDEAEVFGPGTCRYGGKLYVSAQQIPRDDPCDFCFCFRSDIICLQQSCPPPITGCHEEPIMGFCCPRYECPISIAATLNLTTTSTTLSPSFTYFSNAKNVQRLGCMINGRSYSVGEKIDSTSGPCINCLCGGDGNMKCDPQACVPEPTMQQVMAVVAAGRKR